MNHAPRNLEHCQDHPDALVRHVYDADFYIMNGERAGSGVNRRTVNYECAECGKKLEVFDVRAHYRKHPLPVTFE